MSGFFLCALAASLFGISPVFSRRMSLSGMDGASIVCLIHAFTALINAILWFFTPKVKEIQLTRKQVLQLLCVGALGMGSTTFLLAVSYNYIPTGTATVLHFLYPCVVTIVTAIHTHRRVRRNGILSMVLSVLGMVFLAGGFSQGVWIGVLLALASACTYTLYLSANQWASYAALPGPIKMTLLATGSSILFFCKSMLSGRVILPPEPIAWASLWAMACCACVAHSCLTAGVRRIGAEQAAFTTLIEPLVSLLAGAVIYQEALTAYSLAGAGLVLLAVFLHARDNYP